MAGAGHGPEGAPARRRAFAEFVRLALHAAADQVEPRADALEAIRARISTASALRDRLAARRRGRNGAGKGARGGPILNP
jgi:hypothetical protein